MAIEIFNSPGSFSWTPPAKVTNIRITCYGAGGAGGQPFTGKGGGGGGGGGGGACSIKDVTINPLNSFTVYVGNGGNGEDLTNGEDSYFMEGATTHCLAAGGKCSISGAGGLGGTDTDSIGDTVYIGGDGITATGSDGGGGGAAGTENSGNAGSGIIGGSGGTVGGGDGGQGEEYPIFAGSVGNAYGGGGGGTEFDGSIGYDGAFGAVIIEYTLSRRDSWGGGASYYLGGGVTGF